MDFRCWGWRLGLRGVGWMDIVGMMERWGWVLGSRVCLMLKSIDTIPSNVKFP
jgi:hypothetical protein